jgi:tetratricopeptide (TPR) repeat protein
LLAFTFSAAALLAWSGPWCVPLYGLALLSKETSVIVPVFALAHFFFSSQADRRRLLLPLGALASMTGAYLVFRFLALRPLPIPFAAPENLHPWLNLSWYARLLLWPSPLCLAHAAPLNISPFLGLLPLAFAGIAWFLRKRPALLACAAWILIALLPFLQIIPVENINPVADRYLYMACAGFCALAAAALPKPLAFALALAWGALACVRNEQFRAPAALYEQTVACAPDAPQAHSLLGDYRMSSGDWPGAEESYSKALALDPRSPDALENIGAVQFQRGDRSAARLSLERAAAAEPASARVQYNLGALFAVQKDKTRAADYFRRALTLDPDYAPARRALDELQK